MVDNTTFLSTFASHFPISMYKNLYIFGFMKFNGRYKLGGEIYREQRRKRIIITIVFGVLGFAVFNLILYALTTI